MLKVKKWDVYWKMTLTWNSERRISGKGKSTYVECICVCWTKKWVCLNSLRQGDTKWCGCQNRIHWMTNTRLFRLFHWMIQRCTNPRCRERPYYWWKWVKILWKDFMEFYNDMHESYEIHVSRYWEWQTTIDRIDVNWNYCKENCRWATRTEQNDNLTSNRKFNYKWKEYPTFASLCREFWIWKSAMRWRLNSWWSLEKAIETPLQKHNRKNDVGL